MWHDARTLNVMANALVLLAAFIFLMAGLIWVAQQAYFNLAVIEFEMMPGTAPIVSQRLRAALGWPQNDTTGERSRSNPRLIRQQDNFFTVDLDQVRQAFEAVPWVRRATIYRVWPNALRVYIEGQQPLARWNKNQCLNTWGEAFNVNPEDLTGNRVLAPLPHFYGPLGSESLVVQRYAELVRWFAPLDLHVTTLTLSPRYAWRATLSNGLLLDLGRDPGADALYSDGSPGALPFAARLQRLVQAWPILMQKLAGRPLLRVDLRYPNGFALALAPLASPDTKTQLKPPLKKYERHDSRH